MRGTVACCVAALLIATGCAPDAGEAESQASPAGPAEETAETVELRMATYTGSQSADNDAYVKWAELVEELSGGSVTIEIFNQGSLLPAEDVLPGVKDGRADIGAPVYAYHPNELPLSHIVNLPFRTANMPAEAEAFYELGRENEAYANEFESAGVKFLFNWITGPPLLGCSEPVDSLDDLRGRNLRAVGLTAVPYQALGANIQALPFPEVREGIQRGLIDCWSSIAMDTAVDGGLQEVTPYIYDPGYGNFGTFHVVMNLDAWESLSESQQEALDQASREIVGQIQTITDARYEVACQELRDSTELSAWPEALRADWEETVGDAVLEKYTELTANAGADGPAFVEAYSALLQEKERDHDDYESALTRCIRGDL